MGNVLLIHVSGHKRPYIIFIFLNVMFNLAFINIF